MVSEVIMGQLVVFAVIVVIVVILVIIIVIIKFFVYLYFLFLSPIGGIVPSRLLAHGASNEQHGQPNKNR
jgi:hypothetical protein